MWKSSLIILMLFSFIPFSDVFAGESDTYDFSWLDPDKKVYVLQNRKYRKANKFRASVGGGITTSGSFVDSKAYQGRLSYFLKEEWGFELLYSKNSGEENDAAKSVRNEGLAGSTPFRRIIDNYQAALLVWSPFYAKINTFNKIIYLDWLIGLGYANLQETNNRGEFLVGGTSTAQQTEKHNGIIWETGLLFYLNEYLDLRMDLTAIHYQAEKAALTTTEKIYYNNYDLTLSLGVRF